MKTRLLFLCLSFLGLCLSFLGASCASTPREWPPLEPPVRVLLLGDSISIGYTPFVQDTLDERFVVHRPTAANGRPRNCEGTTRGVERIDEWLAEDGGGWDVVHFNFGLHDIKHVNPVTGDGSNRVEDPRQASPEKYAEQLRSIIETLQRSGARLIFATTTPVPEGDLRPLREIGDAPLYNGVALEVLADVPGGDEIVVNDLWSFVEQRPHLKQLGNVHFTPEGSALLGAEVARVVTVVAGLPLAE